MEIKISKKWLFKLLIMLLFPIILSLYLFNPFIEYPVGDKLVKVLDYEEPLNKYTIIIGEFNKTDVENSLISTYIEEITNVATGFKKYDLYFGDKSYIEKTDVLFLEYNLTIEGKNFSVGYEENKRLVPNVDFEKEYLVILLPHLTIVQKEEITESEFRPSNYWFIKKSREEFLIKTILLILFWNVIFIMPSNFLYDHLIKRRK